jgi:hypothetical protein
MHFVQVYSKIVVFTLSHIPKSIPKASCVHYYTVDSVHYTVDKLRMLHPEGNLDYPKDARPSLQQEAEFWEGEEGRNLLGDTFSIRNVSAYART